MSYVAAWFDLWLCLGALVAQLFGAFVDEEGSLGKMRTTRAQPALKAGRAP